VEQPQKNAFERRTSRCGHMLTFVST